MQVNEEEFFDRWKEAFLKAKTRQEQLGILHAMAFDFSLSMVDIEFFHEMIRDKLREKGIK